jgi:hypothetical protein
MVADPSDFEIIFYGITETVVSWVPPDVVTVKLLSYCVILDKYTYRTIRRICSSFNNYPVYDRVMYWSLRVTSQWRDNEFSTVDVQ